MNATFDGGGTGQSSSNIAGQLTQARGTKTFVATPLASREARHFVDAWLTENGLVYLAERADLAVSELAANAALHTGRPFTVSIVEDNGVVRVEVIDSSPDREPMRVPTKGTAVDITEFSETGRGLQIVSALANRWGITVDANIKTVWCEFGPSEPQAPSDPVEVVHRTEATPSAPLHRIELLGMPVRAAISSGLDVEAAIRDIQALPQTEETAALFDLIDRTAPLRLAGRHAAMQAASEDHFEFDLVIEATDAELLATAELNDALMRRRMPRGRSGPTSEVRAFRQWVADETLRQRDGQPPVRYPIVHGNDERDWLWEHAPCGYAHATPDGRLVHVNRTLLNWLDLDASAVYEMSFSDLLDDASRDSLLSELRPLLRSSGRLEDAKVTLVCADGTLLSARVSGVFERDEKGEPAGIRAVIDLESRPAPENEGRELELLQALQRTLIPAVPPEVPGLEVAVRYQPAVGEVGGDFFDLFEVTENDWCVLLGDVSGKGVEAGIVTARARHAARSAALRERTPSGLLAALNAALLLDDHTRFCTVALARLQLLNDACIVTIALGGHPFPLLLRHGTVTPMGHAGSLLGSFAEVEFHDVSIRLASGDALVLYTDGVTEARDEFGQFFGEARTHAAIVTAGPSADDIADSVMESVLDFRTGSADDIALVVIRRP